MSCMNSYEMMMLLMMSWSKSSNWQRTRASNPNSAATMVSITCEYPSHRKRAFSISIETFKAVRDWKWSSFASVFKSASTATSVHVYP